MPPLTDARMRSILYRCRPERTTEVRRRARPRAAERTLISWSAMILITVDLRDVVLFTTTLLAIVNPISSAVFFASMSGRFGGTIQRRMANQSAFAILVILLV